MQPGKLNPCSLQLTNDTEEHVAFKLTTAETVDWWEHLCLPRYGTVPARSKYTLVLTVLLERDDIVPEKRFCDMILESCTSESNEYVWNAHDHEALFEAKKAENVVSQVKLTAFLSRRRLPIVSMVRKHCNFSARSSWYKIITTGK